MVGHERADDIQHAGIQLELLQLGEELTEQRHFQIDLLVEPAHRRKFHQLRSQIPDHFHRFQIQGLEQFSKVDFKDKLNFQDKMDEYDEEHSEEDGARVGNFVNSIILQLLILYFSNYFKIYKQLFIIFFFQLATSRKIKPSK